MNIQYHLKNLYITNDSNDKSGHVDLRGILNEDAISSKMLKRGTGLTKQEILGVIDLYTEVVSDQVQSGFAVNTRLANFKPGVKGIFKSVTDPFDPNRHIFRASISEGVVLKKKMREAVGVRQTSTSPKPAIIEYYDDGTSKNNKSLTPGNIGEISGEHLKFNQSDKTEGIFFINEEDSAETRVQTLSVHTEGRLMFLVPSGLTTGKYTLEVRRIYTSPADIRTDRLNKILSVKAS